MSAGDGGSALDVRVLKVEAGASARPIVSARDEHARRFAVEGLEAKDRLRKSVGRLGSPEGLVKTRFDTGSARSVKDARKRASQAQLTMIWCVIDVDPSVI